MRKETRKVGKYEVGHTIGEGTFSKVKFARNMETGESVAIKVMDKTTILKHKMVDQIKREISITKIVSHPNIVRLHEVLASQTDIYIILETGGELFDEIVHQERLPENKARQYFQQLIDAVAHCHEKGVYHRDLRPENLFLDSYGNLKVSDFGPSAFPQKGVELHTTCGTPNYLAPEVLSSQDYDGAAADIWSCGVILYVLMAGCLPFEGTDLPTLYRKINAAEFSCPFWFSPGATSLIHKILDPNPNTRIQIEGIKKDPWFQKNYMPINHREEEKVNLDLFCAVFDDIEDQYVAEQSENSEGGPLIMNAFEMITLSQGLNQSPLFDRRQTDQHIIEIRQNAVNHGTHQRGDGWSQKDLEWMFVITNLVLELPSAVFDQLSSVHKPLYALISMSVSLIAILVCILQLIYKGQKKSVAWRWTGRIPWFYEPSPSNTQFVTLTDTIGLACAISQFIVTAINYSFARRNTNDPIKICAWPIIFALGLLCSKFFEDHTRGREIIESQNRTH